MKLWYTKFVADVIDNQFYEADCYIRGTNLVAKYNYWNGDKSEYTYYTQNAHGDVVNLTDKDGKITKSYRYDAFGVEINPDTEDVNVFRFCGEYFDTETGTVYLRARYYQASTGRFISRDSYSGKKSDPLSLNLYTYCRNNPISYVDPSGYSYATLPNGKRMSINSASDAKLFNELKSGKSQSSQVKTTTPTMQDSPITGGITTQQSTTTYTTVQTKKEFILPEEKTLNLFSRFFGAEYSCFYEENVKEISFSLEPYKFETSTSLKTQLAKSRNSSKLITFYFNQNADKFYKSSMGIKLNISKFTYNYNVGIGQVGYNYTYNESEYSSWSLGYGLNGLNGYASINNTIQIDDGITESTNFTGSFNGLIMFAAVAAGKVSSSGNISDLVSQLKALTNLE